MKDGRILLSKGYGYSDLDKQNFTNETGGISQKLNNHSGTAKFLYYQDKYMFDGVYYNVLGNTGEIKISFEQETLLGRLIP